MSQWNVEGAHMPASQLKSPGHNTTSSGFQEPLPRRGCSADVEGASSDNMDVGETADPTHAPSCRPYCEREMPFVRHWQNRGSDSDSNTDATSKLSDSEDSLHSDNDDSYRRFCREGGLDTNEFAAFISETVRSPSNATVKCQEIPSTAAGQPKGPAAAVRHRRWQDRASSSPSASPSDTSEDEDTTGQVPRASASEGSSEDLSAPESEDLQPFVCALCNAQVAWGDIQMHAIEHDEERYRRDVAGQR